MRSLKGSFRWMSGGTTGYSYTNTRAIVRTSFLLKPEDFRKMMNMSLPEIANHLGQGVYKREIEELGIMFEGANLIEYSLNRNLEKTFHQILEFSLKKARAQIILYLRRYDIANIKTIIRGKSSGAPNEKMINELIACGELTREFLKDVIEKSSDKDEAIESFKGTDFYQILKMYGGDLTKMEEELDKSYYAHVLRYAEKELKDYIEYEINVKNTLNRLRGGKAAVNIELLAEGRERKLPAGIKGDSIETRVMLRRFLVKKGMKMLHEFRNIRPVLGYFIAKENEVSNIRVIARGKHTGLPGDLINRHLVV